MILKMMIVMCIFVSPCSSQRWPGRWSPGRSFANLLPRYSVPLAEPEPQSEPFRSWTLSRPFSLPLPEPEPEPEPIPFANRKSRRINQKLRVLPTTTTTTKTTTTTTAPPPPRTIATIRTIMTTKEYIRELEKNTLSMPTPSPWSIDTAQFQIVAAVPEHDREREEKKGFNEKVEELEIPSQFMPVPAVPSLGDMLGRKPKKILDNVDDVVNKVKEEDTEVKNRKCLEKCVPQFCIQDKEFNLFSSCVEKCKSFCA